MKKIIFILISLAFLGLSTLHAQVKVGDNPTVIDDSAILELESTEKGFLPPRLSTAERPVNPATGLVIYNTTIKCLETYNGTGWQSLCDGSVVGPVINDPANACNGEPEFFFFEGLEYKPVESGPTNDKKCWLDRNLGATRVATSTNDFQAYGSLYQWGRGNDDHQLITWTESSTSTTNNTVSNTTSGPVVAGTEGDNFITVNASPDDWLSPQDDNRWGNPNDDDKGPEDPCPPGYRVPSEAELDAERVSWASNNNATGAIASPLKLPVAGLRRTNGGLQDVGATGNYWSSTVSNSMAELLFFNSSSTNMSSNLRAAGASVRCIKE